MEGGRTRINSRAGELHTPITVAPWQDSWTHELSKEKPLRNMYLQSVKMGIQPYQKRLVGPVCEVGGRDDPLPRFAVRRSLPGIVEPGQPAGRGEYIWEARRAHFESHALAWSLPEDMVLRRVCLPQPNGQMPPAGLG